jgi:hypothetical protein
MKPLVFAAVIVVGLGFEQASSTQDRRQPTPASTVSSAEPVIAWSHEARRAIVPAGPNGIFGTENYGNKFPGEAAIYMGIVHAAMYDTAVALEGGYRPYAIRLTAPANTSAKAAIATVVHDVLIGLQPALGLTPEQRHILEQQYQTYLAAIHDNGAKSNGTELGRRIASAVIELRHDDGRDRTPRLIDLDPPAPGPGVWDEGAAPAIGLRVPGIRPLALKSASQFRPAGPTPLESDRYARDFTQVAALGRLDSERRQEEHTTQALFWTDHDLRQWNDGLLRIATHQRLDFVRTARMLAMAHAAGGDAMIACFDAKYRFWFWRPYQAIPGAADDGNDATEPDPSWRPLRTTPNFPEYPSAHACHTSAIATALTAFFGTDKIRFSLDSRATKTTRVYNRFPDIVEDVNLARVLVGFHFRHSDQDGARLGRRVGRYVATHRFTPIH